MNRLLALPIAILLAGPALAENITCAMTDGATLSFNIDHNQFVAPQDPNDPPRRKVTTVRYGDKQFPAEPIVMGNLRGFHAEGLGGTATMFMMQPNGDATFTNRQDGLRVTGTCQVAG